MKQLILILALLPLAGFGQTKNVLKGISTNALTEPLVVPTGKSITIDSGATITNNGTATGFGGAWGSITGTLSAQTDLQSALDAKLASATAASTYQLIIGDGDLTIARTSGLQTALDAKQPLAGALTTLSSATAAGLALMDDADAAAQRTTLGLVIGTNVQAYDADLTTYAGITPSANVQTLLGAADFAAVRTALSLGAAALLEVSTGGNAAPDQDKLARYRAFGQLAATANMIVYDDDFPAEANKAAYYAHNSISLPNGGGLYVTLQAPGNSAAITITLPPVSGTLIGTGNLTSITALGTVTTGTWQADDIALAYLAQGGATDGQAMVWDNTAGTWEPGTISTGITVGTTSVASGTDGYILYNNAGTLGQLASTGTGNVVRATSPTITGTLTAATIYGQGIDQLADGVFLVHPSLYSSGTGAGVQIWNNWSLHWRTTNSVALWGDVADQLWLRNTTRAQGVVIANTWSSTTSYETVDIGWSGSVAHLWTSKGSGGGTARDLVLGFDATEKLRVNSSGVTIGSGGSAIATVKRTSATLVAGTVTVSDTDTTANSHIVVTVVTPGGTVGFLDFDVSAGSSYTINSSSILETSTVIITALHYP